MNKQTVTKDTRNRQLIIKRGFAAPINKVWAAWTDRNKLDKWWGPRTWPTTTKSFDFREGGHWHYNMTGPDGTRVWAWIDYEKIIQLVKFTAQDSFCDERGNKNTEMPSSHWSVEFDDRGQETFVTTTLTFATEDAMARIIEMGFEGGFTEQLDRLDEFLAA
jgi:uncharacterized protein YndB with AHSA1/START domain